MPAEIENIVGAASGRQAKIRGSGVAALVTDEGLDRKILLEATTLATATTTYWRMETAGSTTLDIILKPSLVSGTPVVTAYATLADGITQKGAATTLTAPSGTTQVVTRIEDLGGERFWVLKIVSGAGGNTTFSQAEYTTN